VHSRIGAWQRTGLDDGLDRAARDSPTSIRGFIDKDKLMQSLDGNEILGDMHVAAPKWQRLAAIEAALG
jgi:hypothetical protein